MTIISLTGFLLMFSMPAGAITPEVEEGATSESTSQPKGIWLLSDSLKKYFPESPPVPGNAAKYYTEAFAIWNKISQEVNSQTRNNPEMLERMAEVNEAIDLIEEGATFRDCDFYPYYDFSPSLYFQKRPNTIATKMLVKLIMRRAERDMSAGRLKDAERRAKTCVIFSTHLYQTSETHTQATMSMEILSAGFGLLHNTYMVAQNIPEAEEARRLQQRYKFLMVQHVRVAPSLRYGLPNDLDSILQALTNPLAPVRCEGLRTLGNIMDPRVDPDYLIQPGYRKARERAMRLKSDLTQIVGDMRNDPDPRVARLASNLHDVMTGKVELKREVTSPMDRLSSATTLEDIEEILEDIAP